MSNWEKFKQSQQNQPQQTGNGPVGRKIDGNYMCQHCYQMVNEGTYFPGEGVLEYVCEEGHKSFIEKFFLA